MITEPKKMLFDKLKFNSIIDGSSQYPRISLKLYNKNRKETIPVTSDLIFGKDIGFSKTPLFTFNIELPINTDLTIAFSEISDEILLENIELLNKTMKEFPQVNLINDISKVKNFKTYLLSSSLFPNKLYNKYKELLEKLFFFSEKLFEQTYIELEKIRKKEMSKNGKKKEKLKINLKIENGESTESLQRINVIISENMERISKLLTEKILNYDISEQTYEKGNLYQIVDGIISVKSKQYEDYKIDYIEDLKMLKSSDQVGNFYVLIKGATFIGDFNSFISCKIKKKIKLDYKECKKKYTLIKDLFKKVFEGGTKQTRRKRNGFQRSRKKFRNRKNSKRLI